MTTIGHPPHPLSLSPGGERVKILDGLLVEVDSRYKLIAKGIKLRAVLDERLCIKVAASDSSLARNRWE